MPIYAYKCESCGYAKDVLQKMSDTPLTDCPECGKSSFKKQLTAAGFQLKGSGWYVTDFRGGDSGGKKADPASGGDTPASGKDGKDSQSGTPAASSAPSTPAASAPAAPASAAPASSKPSSSTAPSKPSS
ncbi:hypothetical protein AwPolaro_04480 [Polaromonas sp.]|nr:hypothetical protein AwPolaro_04480 [Polaromonas sp.]